MGSRSEQLALPLSYSKPATDELGRPLPPQFWRWFGKSQAVDDEGRPLVFWHGSREPDIDTFEVQNTSYGYFFAHDRATAAYYGPHLYEVYLKTENPADLDDWETFERVAAEATWSDKKVRFSEDRYGERRPMEEKEWREAFSSEVFSALREQDEGTRKKVWAWWRATIRGLKDLDESDKKLLLAGDPEAIRSTIDFEDWDDDSDEVAEFWRAVPKRKVAFDRLYPLLNPDVEQARADYGEQNFYMNQQDDFLHAAENMGHDAVIFTDPSPSGESISWVIFNPKNVKSVKNRGSFDPRDPRMSYNRTSRRSR